MTSTQAPEGVDPDAYPTLVEIPVAEIGPGPKVRYERIDLDHVARLRLAIDSLPAITVRQGPKGWLLVDGQHRLSAHKFEERATLRCQVLELDDAQALEAAAKANIDHGLPLTLAERSKVARDLLTATDWSNVRIAASCGLDDETVARMRPVQPSETGRLNKTTGTDGKSRPATQDDAKAQRAAAADYITEHPGATLREVKEATGAGLATAAKVKAELTKDSTEPPSRPTLAAVPDAPAETTVADTVLVWPKRGYRHEPAFQTGKDVQQAGAFLDRLVERVYEGKPDPFDVAAVIPAAWAPHVVADALAMAAHWSRLAEAIANRPPMEVAR